MDRRDGPGIRRLRGEGQCAVRRCPRGYGGYGWGGWGGYGGGIGPGSIAAGIGAFNAQTGYANVENAQARAVNANTLMQWNNYVYQSNLNANRMYLEQNAAVSKANSAARAKIRRRLRNDPSQGDIERGDALNVALDEVTNPKIDWRSLKSGPRHLPRHDDPGDPLPEGVGGDHDERGRPDQGGTARGLEGGRLRLRSRDHARDRRPTPQGEPGGRRPNPETLAKAHAQVKETRAKVEKMYPEGSPERRDADRYLKALLGLLRILDTPAIDVVLAGVEKHPEVTLADLVGFMKAYNFRFGVAKTPGQHDIYNRLYPRLVKLRDEADAGDPYASAAPAPAPADPARAGEFFSDMEYQHLQPPPAPTPAPPPNPPK